MEEICNKQKCSGCCACMNICPKNCISMDYDEYGVVYPNIDEEKCIHCNACKRVCPVNCETEKNRAQTAYAAWHNNEEARRTSASGGVAAAFYETVIENKGVCFGTCFDENLNLNIVKAITKEEIKMFKGSKYVQAYVGMSLKQAQEELRAGKQVLFIGTPCQIAGVRNFLMKDYDNLITVDLICHGVPSIRYLQEHICTIERKVHQNVDNISFRGEDNFMLVLYKDLQKIYKKDRYLDNYFVGFLQGLFYRPNCYKCPYACAERVGDITIGDFWGLGTEEPCEYGMENGVSVILPNTEKGIDFINSAKFKLFLDKRPITEAINGNTQLREPSEKHVNYNEFRKLYLKYGYERAAGKCTRNEIQKYRIEQIQNSLKWKIKRILRIK